MIREAELFVLADRAWAGLVGRIRDDRWDGLVPPVFDMFGGQGPVAVRPMVNHIARDDAWAPAMLAGSTMDEIGRERFDGDLLGDDPHAAAVRYAEAAQVAARTATDRDAPVHCGYGDAPTWHFLWQLTIARTLSATDLAAHLGVPDPLTEELARGLWEGTSPLADQWREYGVYRAELPVADGASWRERYLALTGRSMMAP